MPKKQTTKVSGIPGGAVVELQPNFPELSTAKFRISDRLQMARSGIRNRIGASCNVFVVDDSIQSIGEALDWALHVCHQQGAPSLHFGNLRPRGSLISTGGVSGGAVPFIRMFDALVHNIKRDTYKKGAAIAWLPWNHQDLPEALAADFQSIYRGVSVPGDHEPELQKEFAADEARVTLIAQAFEKGKCFVCKNPEPGKFGSLLYRNLCTEVQIPHRGTCVLGVVNLSQYTPNNVSHLPGDYRKAALEMYEGMQDSLRLSASSPLHCGSPDNVQFGLGFSGLASTLANWNLTYEDFTSALSNVVFSGSTTIKELVRVSRTLMQTNSSESAYLLTYYLTLAYSEATSAVAGKVTKAFTVQPSATGAYECADAAGYFSSPELQPVIGIRDAFGVHTLRKSQLKGDTKVVFHPRTQTTEEVPYATYAKLCECWQLLMQSTGLAHSHSSCWYGSEFTEADLRAFMGSAMHNLYYRLPSYNHLALDKTNVGEGVETTEEFSVDELLSACSLVQQPGDSDCGCTG